MKSNEERIELMHRKAEKLRRERDRKLMAVSAGMGVLMFAMLIAASIGIDGQVSDYVETTFAASSLFEVSIGGYVIVAVAAFMIGVAITALIKKYYKPNKGEETKDE